MLLRLGAGPSLQPVAERHGQDSAAHLEHRVGHDLRKRNRGAAPYHQGDVLQDDRDADLVQKRLKEVRRAADMTDNLLPTLRQALKDRCTLGEVCGAMKDVFGEYQPTF